jgi:hypothetical protein
MPSLPAPDKSQGDDSYWLWETQKLLTNVRHWINHGRSETAEAAIESYWQRWAAAPKGGQNELA